MTKPGAREGLVAALGNIAVTLVAMGQTRLELLGNEIETQKLQALRMLLLAQVMLFCATVGVLLLVAVVALMLWEQRLGVVAAFTGFFLLAAAWFYRSLARIVNAPEPAFATSLAELKEDLRRLKTLSAHANAPD